MFYILQMLKKKKLNFLKIQIILVIFFGISYYLLEKFNYKYFNLAQKMGLVRSGIKSDEYNIPGGLGYYLWFSTITQTTVGYAGLIDSEGNSIPFEKNNSNSFIFLNFVQLLSTLLVAAFMV